MIFNLWDLVIEVSDVNKIECLVYPSYHFQHLVFTRFTDFTKKKKHCNLLCTDGLSTMKQTHSQLEIVNSEHMITSLASGSRSFNIFQINPFLTNSTSQPPFLSRSLFALTS